ncbi:hypothetical protein KNT87_gp031 [Erwinia phage Cronus]|uniref:Uncharacterized protein n=1 Tax=Erwinia phage Cronus TaxID=2163633 RepID=A0A2S1GM63_9CAUD|nr:hypothetical protein KNT87_gp031 [Erwinia phage Cronus]AWD90470.1 hypothetical protein [Erwinia phage Cronus]
MVFVYTTEDDQYGRQSIVSASSDFIEALEVFNKEIKSVNKGLNSLTAYENGRAAFTCSYLEGDGTETYENVMSKVKKI